MSTLKETGNLDGGTATIIGGTDWDRLIGYFKGKPNQFQAFINSDTEYKWGKLWLRNQSDTFSQNIRAGNVTNNYTMTLPSYNANDELVSCNAPQTIKNKTINFAENTIIGSGTGGTSGEGKWGLIQAPRNANDGTVSQGTLSGHINMGTLVSMDTGPPPAGNFWVYGTGTTMNANAGVRWGNAWIRRDFNPKLRVKFRTPLGPTGAQLLIGLSTDTDISATQDPLENSHSGVLVGYTSDNANFVVIRNGGTSSQTTGALVDDTSTSSTVNKSTSLYRIVEIAFTNSGNDCTVRILKFDTTAPYGLTQEFSKVYTTNLPAITIPNTGGSVYMRPVCQITNKESAAHNLELFKMELYTDF